jgi:hypothetical protein
MALTWHWIPAGWGVTPGSAYKKALGTTRPVHDLVAREVIQNSWDAAQRLRAEHADTDGIDVEREKFKMVFQFEEFTGAKKSKLLNAINFQELVEQLKEVGHEKLSLEKDKTVLDHAKDSTPLKALYIHDYGATGLRGNPVGPNFADSDFFRAFGDLGGNDRSSGGGSYGFGKSAFIKASRINLVVAYSSFMAEPGDSITTRLWGFLFWPKFSGKVGVAQLGNLIQGGNGQMSAPAENELADQLAEQFGFQVRNANTLENCGTSLLILDHILEPEALQASVEKWWWPALESYKSTFDISIMANGKISRPQAKSNPILSPYVRAFEIATDPSSSISNADEYRPEWRGIREVGIHPGSMALVHVEATPEDLERDGAYSLVALIREPRMVVEYQPHQIGTLSTAMKGVYIASSEADPYLRMSEPSTHDLWQIDMDSSSGPNWEKSRDVVRSVQNRIRKGVSEFHASLRKKSKPKGGRLRFATDLLATLLTDPINSGSSSRGTRKPPGKKIVKDTGTYISTLLSTRRDLVGNKVVRREIWEIQLSKVIADDTLGRVDFGAWVVADGSETSTTDKLSCELVKNVTGFNKNLDGSYIGTLKPGKTYTFEFKSEPYDQNWALKTDISVNFPQKGDN